MSISHLPSNDDDGRTLATEDNCEGCILEGRTVCNPPPEEAPRSDSSPAPPVDDRRKVWQSTELLGDDCEAIIVHRGQQYRLRCTKQGKLILYK